MNPKVFGWQHLTFLAIFVVFMIASLVLIKLFARSEKSKFIVVKVVAILLFAFILWNRISIVISENDWTRIIPDSFCGMGSLVLSLACLFGKANNNILHFVFYVSIVGGFLVLIYPDFLGQNPSFLYPNTISGLLHHGFSFYLCVLLLLVGWFTPNYKKWPNVVIGFMAFITIGTFEMSVFGYNNAFYINKPILAGTPLTVWLIAVIFMVAYALFFVCYELIKKKIKNGTAKSIKGQSEKE